ncbi:MAG: TIGR00730 family Rossman fold protein, partial [Oscillospiraceae bacterium]|nr:TIGR00730 family Rossman fold protein [Oscillospiraceae bacterium]
DGVLFEGCTELILTDTMAQRKQLLAERADAFAALPGGVGTLDELFEILTLRQLGLHGKPVALLNTEGYYDPLLAMLDRAASEGFMTDEARGLAAVFREAAPLLDHLETARREARLLKNL